MQVTGTELERERAYVTRLYGRLDAVRAETRDQLTAVRDSPTGGTHQNRSERDAFARIYEDRLQALREVDERLVFGRLEFEDGHLPEDEPRDGAPARTPGDGDPVYRYIGRIGLRDDDLQPLLLDWRVPQASAFYQATAATPLGARARRHLTTHGREVVHVEDEVFDPTLLDEGRTSLQGEGALLAALAAGRTGRMNDIVATIQAEQDRIIRSGLRGVLVVQGGPGTGKTAVALHRAAYLLYSHRDRLASSGVLVVGPSRSFLQYIEAVLPSLGETGVVLASVGQLYPGIDAAGEDAPEVAAVKGSAEMAGLLQRAVRSRQVVPTEAVTLDVNGERIVLEPSLVAGALRRAQDSRKPHNEARVVFNKAALGSLAQVLASQMRRNGSALDDSDLAMLREDLRTSYDVKVALNTAWLPLTPEKLIQDLYARPNWLASLTPRWSPERRALLRRDRDAPFTIADVPLLDEAAELLGEFSAQADASAREREQQRLRDIENAEQAIENMGVGGMVTAERLAEGFAEQAARRTTAERAASDRTWTYGHIVVDEAQELSPMQWRVLLRRCPLRSFTIVGDVAQASSAVGVTSWQDALGPVLGREWRLEELTVNYRTPARIAEAAERMAIAHGLPVTRSRAVREGEHPIDTVEVDADEVVSAVVDVVDEEREGGDTGTLAVIARDDRVEELHRALAERFGSAVGIGVGGLGRPIAVLGSQEAKGLEFDVVVIAEPDEILAHTSRGAAGLYVAMTRPTQRLHVVTSTGFAA
ncbi:AAA family ATPase [Clavibacter michiganensis subsp. michiganensis]|nr:AAA family ATPase [Clavibacter michiganensis]MDO4032521.1 AAA family ATPase [Clavibacter michiganensis]MDO4081847.1 AAA family ATPase [Clavibacter michiganensis]MDO4088011.1 AAA family ATPase [Clavibacter michiganensis]MDO4096550.1 AAA family ATPase [Clavibacter michiganensis]MDO4137165.1 AAA family ATPase [Clavibacter michiganensis]